VERGHSDEISLAEMWRVIVRYRAIILAVFIASVLLSIVVVSVQPKVYRGEVTVLLVAEEVEKDPLITAIMLSSPRELITPAKEIESMYGRIDKSKATLVFPNSHSYVESARLTALKNSYDKIRISVESTSLEHLATALGELVEYLRKSPIVRNLVTKQKEVLMMQISELSKTIELSEGHVKIYRQLLSGQRVSSVGFNLVDMERSLSELKVKKRELEQKLRDLESSKGIEVIDEYHISRNPVKPKKALIIAVAGVSGLFVGVFLAFFIEYVNRQRGN